MNRWVTAGMIFFCHVNTLLRSHAPLAVHPALGDCISSQTLKGNVLVFLIFFFFSSLPTCTLKGELRKISIYVQETASISISSSHYACLLSDEHRSFFQKWYKSIWAGGWKLWRKRQPVERHMEAEKSERYQQLANLLLHFTFICSPHLDTKTVSNTLAPEEKLFPAFSEEAHSIIDIALYSTIIPHCSSEFCI